MSSGGSNSNSINDPVADIESPALVDDTKPSHEEDGVSSMQTSDIYSLPYERCERLKTIHQLTFSPKGVRRDLAKAIVQHDYPLSIVNHMGFRVLFEGVYPSVSQNTLKSDISKIHDCNRDISMGLFNDNDSRIAITVDKWISCEQTRRYIAITGQIINDDWKVERRMMRFAYVPCTFTNELVAKLTAECLFDWEVASKISTIAIDYDESDERCTDILPDQLSSSSLLLGGKLLHTRCFARTMSLMVKEGFDVIGSVIERIRESILFWTATPQREGAFKKASRELSIYDSNCKLNIDYASKWNTTFLMLQTALLLKPVFCHLKKQEFEYLCMPSEEEWELAKEIFEKLGVLYSVIIDSVSEYQSANFFFFDLCSIKLEISEWVTCTNELVRNMALKMQEIFDKYWNSVRDIFAVACVLDHRLKLSAVKSCFEKIYGDGSQNEVEHIHQIFRNLFNEYQIKMTPKKTNCNDHSSSGLDHPKTLTGIIKKFMREKRKREQLDQKPELEAYLEEKVVSIDETDRDIDVLRWWKCTNKPILKKMARDILAIPIFSVAPEHIFDTGDYRVLSPHRSQLHPTMVEKLMCTQSWLWTDIKDSYSVTNSYSWGTSDNYAVVEHDAAEAAKLAQPCLSNGSL